METCPNWMSYRAFRQSCCLYARNLQKAVCDIFLLVCREDLYNSQSSVNLISIALQGLFSTQARAIKAKNIKHVRSSGVKRRQIS